MSLTLRSSRTWSIFGTKDLTFCWHKIIVPPVPAATGLVLGSVLLITVTLSVCCSGSAVVVGGPGRGRRAGSTSTRSKQGRRRRSAPPRCRRHWIRRPARVPRCAPRRSACPLPRHRPLLLSGFDRPGRPPHSAGRSPPHFRPGRGAPAPSDQGLLPPVTSHAGRSCGGPPHWSGTGAGRLSGTR